MPQAIHDDTTIDGGADVIPFAAPAPEQPVPTVTLYDYFPAEAPTGTAISRSWGRGDAAKCDLCVRCTAHADACLVLIHNRVIPESECAMHRQDGPREPRRSAVSVRMRTS